VNIAYQVVGDGPVDLVYIMGWGDESRSLLGGTFLRPVFEPARLFHAPDPFRVPDAELPTLEQRMDDVRMARRTPGAEFVELSGYDHLPWVGDQNAILKEVADFVQSLDQVTGINRVLATVLYPELGYCPSDATDAYRML
jgi:hypothetical protein